MLAAKAIRRKFGDNLREAQDEKKWIVMLGRAGFAARGVVLVLMGAFLIKAAWQYDPDQATGIAGASEHCKGHCTARHCWGSQPSGWHAWACLSLVKQLVGGSRCRQGAPARLA